MQSPYIAAALSHARAQDIERSLQSPERMARHELEIERRHMRGQRPTRRAAWRSAIAGLVRARRGGAPAATEPPNSSWATSEPQHEASANAG